uniref:Helix-turn-helix domain protein n=1 Tax=Myoviridae sp. ctq9w2 TaxID=2825177 RepID=A0A8S5PXN3_9CAUD|nr:MAG TPA: helix-turn-helix domain protein [Myoviridae sp. ctq9w2]
MLALYKNIKARRLELKMSQDRLAELTGYKDRSSIAKIEKGEVDLAESKIREFAKALKITPQELMGWDDPDTDISIDETFERICEFYNILNPEGKAEALKRISELSQILQYSANHKAVAIPMAIPYDTLLAAARNDHADDPDETEKMQTDMNLLKRPEKKDDAN